MITLDSKEPFLSLPENLRKYPVKINLKVSGIRAGEREGQLSDPYLHVYTQQTRYQPNPGAIFCGIAIGVSYSLHFIPCDTAVLLCDLLHYDEHFLVCYTLYTLNIFYEYTFWFLLIYLIHLLHKYNFVIFSESCRFGIGN